MKIEYFSELAQDALVQIYLKNKMNGFFIDIGCNFPADINNTFMLEKSFGWDGISIDIEDLNNLLGYHGRYKNMTWKELRKTRHLIMDALKINYLELFKDHSVPDIVDYLTIDLEPPDTTLECLFMIPFREYRFNCISFETDDY